ARYPGAAVVAYGRRGGALRRDAGTGGATTPDALSDLVRVHAAGQTDHGGRDFWRLDRPCAEAGDAAGRPCSPLRGRQRPRRSLRGSDPVASRAAMVDSLVERL